MKRVLLLALVAATITMTIAPLEAQTGTRNGVPPPPMAVVIRAYVAADDPAFPGSEQAIRQFVAQELVLGSVCQYSEFEDSLVFEGPKFPHYVVEFYNYGAFSKAMKTLKPQLPAGKFEMVSASGSKECDAGRNRQ